MLLNHLGDTNLSWILHISYYDTTLTDFKNLLAYQVATDSKFGLGIQDGTVSDSDFVTKNVEGVPVNDSLGFSDSFIGNVLDDSNMSDVNLSDIIVSDFNGSGSAVNSPNVSGNRSSRNKNI